VLISGTAGTGKTSFASALARATCESGERVLYFAFEESPDQIARNMRSIGIDLIPHIESGLLSIVAQRPLIYGLEKHLVTIHKEVQTFQPAVVIMDPVNFASGDNASAVKVMLTRLVDFLKTSGITAFMTYLTEGGTALEATEVGISSILDVWLQVRDIELSGERNRGLFVLKARGMSHSNQIREFTLNSDGIHLANVYLGPAGMLTGSARVAQEARERDAELRRKDESRHKVAQLERKRRVMEARIAALRAEFEAEETEARAGLAYDAEAAERITSDRAEMGHSRGANGTASRQRKK
jgi:circadian clock protein KaiC